jgi:hypothetical protein
LAVDDPSPLEHGKGPADGVSREMMLEHEELYLGQRLSRSISSFGDGGVDMFAKSLGAATARSENGSLAAQRAVGRKHSPPTAGDHDSLPAKQGDRLGDRGATNTEAGG